MKKRLLLLIVFCVGCYFSTFCQVNNNYWINYTCGLETRNIAFEEDTVWVSTLGGLVKIVPSTGTTTFFNASNSGLNTNELHHVEVDLNHNKWIASANGVYLLMGTTWKHFQTGPVFHLEYDFNNNIWFIGINPLTGAQGLIQFDGNTFNTFSSIPGIPGITFKCITTDINKNLWILLDDKFIKYDGSNWQLITTNSLLNGVYASSITVDSQFKIWANSYQKLLHFDNSSWMVFDTSNSPLIYSAVDEITPDDSGNVYICNNRQLLKTNGSTWTVEFDTSNSPSAQYRFFGCTLDSSNNIWTGTCNNGIYKKDSLNWKHYNTSATDLTHWHTSAVAVNQNGDALISNMRDLVIKTDTSWIVYDSLPQNCYGPNYLAVDHDNKFWASLSYSSMAGGPIAVSYDGNIWEFAPINSSTCNNVCVDPSNNKWFATYNGVYKFDGTNWTHYSAGNSPLLDNYVWKVYADKHNNIWVSNDGGLQKFDGSGWQTYNLTALGFASASAGNICEDLQGNIYVSANGAGSIPPHKLAKYDGTNWTVINQLPGNYIGAMKVDKYNNLWVSFLQTGLAKFDGNTWVVYDIFNSGLPYFSSYDMAIDKYNNIWLSTTRGGIAVFNERGLNYDTPTLPHLKVSGHCYFDVDSNGIKNAGEPFLSNQRIVASPFNSNYSTNSIGQYSLFLLPGNYSLAPVPHPAWHISSDSLSYNISVDSLAISGYDFGLTTNGVRNYELNMYSGINRCGFEVPYWIDYKNIGSMLDSGYIEFNMDTSCTFISSFPPPDQISGSSYRWNFTSLIPFLNNYINLNIEIPLSPGDSVHNQARLHYYNGGIPTQSNIQSIDEEIVCAFDPNDKRVFPIGLTSQHLTLKSDTLNYIIRFQNVGNDTAFFVKIIDTLDININPQSIEVISASHPYNLINENGVLIFDFPTCNLPDSSVSYANSCGYIHFKALTKLTTPNNSIVNNQAYIIFNFNSSIITNQVFNTMVDEILNTDDIILNEYVRVSPNPFSNTADIIFPNRNEEKFEVTFRSITGKIIYKFNTYKNSFSISKNNLSEGIYILELISNNKRYYQKIIIQ